MRTGILITGWIVFLWHGCIFIHAQNTEVSRVIRWDEAKRNSSFISAENRSSGKISPFHFDQAVFIYPDSIFPFYHERITSGDIYYGSKVILDNIIFEPIEYPGGIPPVYFDSLHTEVVVKSSVSYSRKKPFLDFRFHPLRKNPGTGEAERVVYFSYKIDNSNVLSQTTTGPAIKLTSTSVLSGGRWIKLKIVEDGIYKLSYEDLVSMGLSDPSSPRIFGNGGDMLPMNTSVPRPDDLTENAIWMEKGGDGIFNQGDYILFYGKGPGSWNLHGSEGLFIHRKHLYSDAAYYYITSDAGEGKMIQLADQAIEPETHTVNRFNDFALHEEETENPIKSGREWYEPILSSGENSFDFTFPDLDPSSPVILKSRLLARSGTTSSFEIEGNDKIIVSASILGVTGNYKFARVYEGRDTFYSNSGEISISVTFSNAGAETWLDYLLLNVRRSLRLNGAQMHFRDTESAGPGNVARFEITNAPSTTRIWDITDIYEIKEMTATYGPGEILFRTKTDSLRSFIAFDGSSYLTPEVFENPVPNQNLHALGPADLIIVCHADFLGQAQQLADFHTNRDGLRVITVTPEEIYNEYSSGTPDVSAIRDFVKMFYDRADNEANLPKYLLLFGDGSYDNKSIHENNTNFILTYQSLNELSSGNAIDITTSYVTDDFYGLLDDGESIETGLIDIGIGRLPVSTIAEAQTMIDKIVNYTDPGTMGDWRNMICFIGDDLDGNVFDGIIHMRDANILASMIETAYPAFNLDKIFLDAFPQVSSSTGESYPDVNKAISDRINSGALIINYVGHGNERGLAHEGILSINDILSWDNYDKLPLFITATCEFSRFDDIDKTVTGEISKRTSAGEYVLLNPEGGGIALLTTTRLVYSTPNFELNQNFYDYAFEKDENQQPYRLGDLLRLTKNDSYSNINKRNFTLLGDPALELAYPRFRIVTDSVNGKTITEADDTLKALSRVRISGHIAGNNGGSLDDFSGILYPTVFDKPQSVTTLGNDKKDDGSTVIMSFDVQNNIIYKGQVSINQGRFTFSFIVPKDISYHIDFGKITYYGHGETENGHGYYKDFLIGGFSEDPDTDNTGPEIELYMNDPLFVSGGITDENPRILALVRDPSGINTIGSGIGHDITAILDEDYQNLFVLNNYYESDLDSYQSGKIEYQLSGLSPGRHSLKLKVWDILNYSSEAFIEFIVTESKTILIKNLINYPNPFADMTYFSFEHNQADNDLEILIRIFDLAGHVVATLKNKIYQGGYRAGPIGWDGRDNRGNKLGAGIYVYRVQLRSSDGHTTEGFRKLVIVR